MSPYLIPKWSVDLESQFIVHPGEEAIEDGEDAWTDGSETWAPHRWPYKAANDPQYRDRPLLFNPAAHIDRIGSTWWNWVTKRSVAASFDIDMEGDGHAATTTTVTETELEAIVERLKLLPYVTLVRSTGGKGVHVYVFFDEKDQPEAANHNEHTRVSLATLVKMSKDACYDFAQHMDAKGVILWFWASSSGPNHSGFNLIHEATESIGAAAIQPYMETKLIGPNRAAKIHGFDDDGNPVTTQSDGEGYKVCDLDDEHKSILKELENFDYDFRWIGEFNMAHTNTRAIAELFEKRAAEGRPLKGIFKTTSVGHVKKPNCFITPRPGGVFQVKRFGNGIGEHPSWNIRGQDTWCYLNEEPSVDGVLDRMCSKRPDKHKFTFEPLELEAALQALGHTLGESVSHLSGAVEVTRRKDGTYYATSKDTGAPGWKTTKSGQKRELPIVQKVVKRAKNLLEDADKKFRNLITPQKKPYGWALLTEEGWINYPSFEKIAASVKQIFGRDTEDAKAMMDQNPWTIVHVPFGPEYPSNDDLPGDQEVKTGRAWNKHAPQLAIQPSDVAGPHPHWDMIYDHLGKSLDEAVRTTEWCQKWGFATGADYLRAWMSSLILFPFQPLPYLFFYGDQNTGKSIFWESAAYLFTKGSVESASGALTNNQGFNFEIANAVIGYVEEKDLSAVKGGAYARMKEWVTGLWLTVTEKGETPFSQPNTLKLVQMANRPTSCPMEDGDSRITAIAVSSIPPKDMVPRALMGDFLKEEAPFFLRTLLTTVLPTSHDRLRVPMLKNKDKADLETMNQEPWEECAEEHLCRMPGHVVKFSDFYKIYKEHCNSLVGVEPVKSRALLQMVRNRSGKFILGTQNNQMCIGNMALSAVVQEKPERFMKPKKPYTLNKGGGLVKCT
jgi:hypothetical protein